MVLLLMFMLNDVIHFKHKFVVCFSYIMIFINTQGLLSLLLLLKITIITIIMLSSDNYHGNKM